MTCPICNKSLRKDNASGLCSATRNKECRRAYQARPEFWERRRASLAAVRREYQALKGRMVVQQRGICPCGELLDLSASGQRGPVLDHDHACCAQQASRSCRACDRAVMHAGCNKAIGFLSESPSRLRNLADYIERWQSTPKIETRSEAA